MRLLAFCLLAFFARPALADITATYEKPDKSSMTVELADNGDLRATGFNKPGAYLLVRNGQCYAVIPTAAGSVVDRCEDLMPAVMAVAEERAPGYQKSMTEVAGRMKSATGTFLVKGEEVTIRGRTGVAWNTRPMAAWAARLPPFIVISQDPGLAQLGRAQALQAEMAARTTPMADNLFSRQITDLLKSGAAISYAGAELTTVSHDPIPPSRFEPPGPPEALADIVKRLRANSTGLNIQAF